MRLVGALLRYCKEVSRRYARTETWSVPNPSTQSSLLGGSRADIIWEFRLCQYGSVPLRNCHSRDRARLSAMVRHQRLLAQYRLNRMFRLARSR
jgi:hypothetical protein